MGETMKIFLLLLRKNLTSRIKHWGQSFIVQVLITVGLFFLLMWGESQDQINNKPLVINESSYPIHNQTTILEEKKRNLGSTWFVYAPMNNFTQEIMKSVKDCLKIDEKNIMGYENEKKMLTELKLFIEKYADQIIYPFGIVFETIPYNNSIEGKVFKYKLRYRSYKEYYREVPQIENLVQMCLDQAYIKKVSKDKSAEKIEWSIQEMPYPSYEKEPKEVELPGLFSFVTFILLISVMYVEMTFPANEKISGVNVLMSLNGINHWKNLLVWLISGIIWSFFYLVPIVLILKFSFPDNPSPVFEYANPLILWLAFLFPIIHICCFGYHISSYFRKPLAGLLVSIIALIVISLFCKMAAGTVCYAEYFFLILNPNMIIIRVLREIEAYGKQRIGVGFSNIFIAASVENPPISSLGVTLIFSILGSFIHFLIAIYITMIRPGQFGVAQHPFSCFQRKNKIRSISRDLESKEIKVLKKEFEPVPEGNLEPGIRIRGLKKVYTTDWIKKIKVHALKGVSVDFYKSQITALLGHNGAGKTTMMSILSGLTSASDGVIFIDGKNIQLDPSSIKSNVSLCPQENMVFPDLNVLQQLMFFGTLKAKNKTTKQLKEEVEILLSKVNLTDKKNSLPDQLSGGQKRRLCLAMAVIGDANVLILDEPTSGMDAESKREVWDIVLKMRGQKTIIISTHDMEEADILGDRIAIMHSGKLKSYGTSMFLKNLYGDGRVEVTLSVEAWFDSSKIFEEIGTEVNVLNEGDGKIVLAIPKAIESLPTCLDKLESSKKKLGITGMSVSITTMEQVFLKITEEEEKKVNYYNNQTRSFEKNIGFAYFMQTFAGYCIKKLVFLKKNPWSFLITILIPCFIALIIYFIQNFDFNRDPLDATLKSYSDPKAFVQSANSSFQNMFIKTIDDYGGSAKIVSPEKNMHNTLLDFAKNNMSDYQKRIILSAEFNETENGTINANGLFSSFAERGIPVTINCLSNTILKSLTNNTDEKIEISIQHLFVDDFYNKDDDNIKNELTFFTIFAFMSLALALYGNHSLVEATTGIKQLQHMTGASKILYWVSMLIVDLIRYTLSILILMGCLVAVDKLLNLQYFHLTEIGIYLALLFLFGLSVLPLVYLTSFFKLSQIATISLLWLSPFVLLIVKSMLQGILESIFSSKTISSIVDYTFCMIPYVSFGEGLAFALSNTMDNSQCRLKPDALKPECEKSYFIDNSKFNRIPLYKIMLFLLGSCFIFFLFILILETHILDKFFGRKNKKPNGAEMDDLVQKENKIVEEEIEKRVKKTVERDNENVFLAHKLMKNYGNLQVVKGISFRVKEGECFGLLGVNGAGKSTTFKMLTGVEIPHGGSMYLKNYGMHDNREKYLSEMGYCPQQNAIIDTLNAWDHLYLFARLRGVPESQIKFIVNSWINKLNLTACAEQPSGTYSGGNKRRLNIAMALIGNPSLVLMDEPTTGVDPAARRSLWNTLKYCQESGQSIIFTSHSMEECEILCNRLVIMVKGRLVCVGPVQELKQRFGGGYNIHVKLSQNQSDANVEQIKQRIESSFICQKMDENSGFLGYHVTDREVTWTLMFEAMNSLKDDYNCVEDFAIISSTLEQLFLQFARGVDDTRNDNQQTSASLIPLV